MIRSSGVDKVPRTGEQRRSPDTEKDPGNEEGPRDRRGSSGLEKVIRNGEVPREPKSPRE